MLDHNGGFVLAALLITGAVLGGYLLYLRSRLAGLRRQLERGRPASVGAEGEGRAAGGDHGPRGEHGQRAQQPV
jgi:CcmD family protein